jgi:hypothetical protein
MRDALGGRDVCWMLEEAETRRGGFGLAALHGTECVCFGVFCRGGASL